MQKNRHYFRFNAKKLIISDTMQKNFHYFRFNAKKTVIIFDLMLRHVIEAKLSKDI